MTLRLAIENMDRLPDGGPLRVEVKGRGLDIGRDAHLDWTLPDPSRHVSAKHCEIRYRDNEYWLFDVSTNGVFVNGAQFRLDAPYRLRDKDRLTIGPYVIAVAIEGAAAASAPPPMATAPGGDVWGGGGDVAPPEDRAAYRVRNRPAASGDFLDFATDAGMSFADRAEAPASPWSDAPPAADEAWLVAPARPAPPPPPRPVEIPRPTRPAEPVVAPPPIAAPRAGPGPAGSARRPGGPLRRRADRAHRSRGRHAGRRHRRPRRRRARRRNRRGAAADDAKPHSDGGEPAADQVGDPLRPSHPVAARPRTTR